MSEMAKEVGDQFVSQGVPKSEHEVQFEAGVRYQGQGFEVVLPIVQKDFAGAGLKKLAQRFT